MNRLQAREPHTPGGPAVAGLAWVGLLTATALALATAGSAGPHWVLLLLFAPVAEEIVFRLGLHEHLLRRRWPAWQANLAVAALFALAHAILRSDPQALAVLLPALLVGALYTRWRSLTPCVLAHALMNGAWLLATAS